MDHPEKNDAEWFCHSNVKPGANGLPEFRKRAVEPYVVELNEEERTAYQRLRVATTAEAA